MKIHRRDVGDVTVLDLDGKLAGGPDADRFEHIIETLIQEHRLNTVLLFRNLKWINSPGIGILTRNYAHYVRSDGRMVVAELNARILTIFEIMIRNIFEIHATEQTAIQALEKKLHAAQH